jgi:hypothetical protein
MMTLAAGLAISDPGSTISTLRTSCSLLCLLGGIALLAMAAYVMARMPTQTK